MATQFKLRRDSSSAWTSANPTLAEGEPGFETDTRKLKIGDGTTPWNSLPYQPVAIDAAAVTSGTFPTSRIADAAVTGAKLADGAVSTDKLADGSVTAGKITAAEQANVVAGKVRSGGLSSGSAITIHVQATQPTSATAGDLWFW